MYCYLGYFEKMDKFTNVRIIAQSNKKDKFELYKVINALDIYYPKRYYYVIEARNKSEAMEQLNRIAKD